MTYGAGLAGRKELLQWADSLAARGDLPRLIRRLILETGKSLVGLGVPAGEGVSTSGWDGTAQALEATAHVPDGLSLWEMSTNQNSGKKANDDYSKRTSAPDARPTKDCTYVAVALRPWVKRTEWGKEKEKDRRWREVRAYGVDDLETWLETAPVTHAWLSEMLGLAPHGLRAAEIWWESWSQETKPAMSPRLVLAGRESTNEVLRARFSASPGVTSVQGASREEIQACVVSVALQLADEGDSRPLSRIAIVDDVAAWRALQLQKERPLILVPGSRAVIDEVSGNSPHHVIVPVVRGTSADHEIPPIDAAAAREVLEGVEGVDDVRADELGRVARRSLVALRRRLASKPELHSPAWADPPVSRPLRAFLLANRWVASAENDVRTVSTLSGLDSEALQDAVDELAVAEDPLIAQVEREVSLVSPYDAWIQLRGELKTADLKRLEQVVRTVLVDVDPALELPAGERWRAGLEGKVSTYSGALKRGLSESLALLSVNGKEVEGGDGALIANYLARQVLEEANKDESGLRWSSLAPNLCLLAEAGPDAFVDAVRAGMAGDSPLLSKMFADPKGQSPMFTAGSPHSSLLWALETIAWSPDHFGQVIDLLARLAEIDPGGELSNRPSESLAAIFCPWHPENAATNAGRLDAIDGLRQRHPDVAWDLMLSMLPEGGQGVHMPTSAPTFREWKGPRKGVLLGDYWDLVTGVVGRLIGDAGHSAVRWAALIEGGANLPKELWPDVRDGLAKAAPNVEGKTELWKALRSFIANHREYAMAEWALPSEEVDQLEAIANDLAPKLAVESQAWLFEGHPDLGVGRGEDYDYGKYVEELDTRRVAAVQQMQDEGGFDSVLKLAAKSSLPGTLGWALAGAPSRATHEKEVLKLLDGDDRSEIVFASSFIARSFRDYGWKWLEGVLGSELPPQTVGRLLLATGDFPRAWEEAERRGHDVGRAFWTEFEPTGLGPDFPHALFVAQRLLGNDRVLAALDILELYLEKGDQDAAKTADLLAECLERMLSLTAEEIGGGRRVSEYTLDRVVQYLEGNRSTVGLKRLASIEWAYLPALGLRPRVPALHEQLARDPDFFVEIVSAVYRPHSASETESSDDARRVAENGYRLLSTWRTLPGSAEDGTVGGEALDAWVTAALDKLTAADRIGVGEVQVGHVLASAPADPDGRWPCKPVRELLEKLQSERVEEGLQTQVFNNRGVTTRAPEAGGEQERELAARYLVWAEAFRDGSPRTASVLRGIASSYEHQAKRNDSEAERRRRGMD